ncbi:MAG TPA: hypothetical protein VF572_04405 [Candidatus Saccharimonadales bacterium]|jgi:hypothetical protein
MKNTTAEQAPTTVVVPEFTGDQWAASQEFLWNQAFQAGEIRAVLEPELDALYEKLGKETVSASSLAERKERSARKEHYWQTHAQLQELKDREHKILSVLERIEAGDADPAEVIALLPKEEDDDQKMDD